ncbi:hypothetical protein K788_0004284 (plasmid) [Paraburkholderia caribensis MBA4]|uniref:Uncharacterized protein n=1 Tax=Paraburkholderia caribensis MBA4 TaxID=1323664 RepID=A0A0P0RP48_9BURK|nr:hypothetical protein [Paraburkholderia caribensis]ALL70748.1 hypothetical protein K788_0004284 [Paraburkholderia caribensis MBA4]
MNNDLQPAHQFQIRITVSEERAGALRADPAAQSYAPLQDVLKRHRAELKCQFDAFADYVKEAEEAGTAAYPLYDWTRQTIENPEKKAKYLRSFTVYVEGEQIYAKETADSLEAALSSLALDRDSGIERVFKYDTNPAHNPQPPQSGGKAQ